MFRYVHTTVTSPQIRLQGILRTPHMPPSACTEPATAYPGEPQSLFLLAKVRFSCFWTSLNGMILATVFQKSEKLLATYSQEEFREGVHPNESLGILVPRGDVA